MKKFLIQLPFDYKEAVLTQARTTREGNDNEYERS